MGEICDCTDTIVNTNNTSQSKSIQLQNLHIFHSRKFLQMNENKRPDHGVKNHGSSFVTTHFQNEQIVKLRRIDSVLYNISRAVFDSQINEIELKRGIKICDDWKAS